MMVYVIQNTQFSTHQPVMFSAQLVNRRTIVEGQRIPVAQEGIVSVGDCDRKNLGSASSIHVVPLWKEIVGGILKEEADLNYLILADLTWSFIIAITGVTSKIMENSSDL